MLKSPYAKTIVAVLGAAVTAALGSVPPNTTVWVLLTILAGALTTVAVYVVPNTPTPSA